VSALEKPLLRDTTVKLAAIRFTSYSNGPGSVSSKSFRSNSSLRSGEANAPKFDRSEAVAILAQETAPGSAAETSAVRAS
jgi:hypothetical protein